MTPEEMLTAIDTKAVEAARAEALPEAHLQLMVETFQALADPTRARILYALIQRPMCVRDLSLLVGVSASGVSHQLRLLRDHLRFIERKPIAKTQAWAPSKGEVSKAMTSGGARWRETLRVELVRLLPKTWMTVRVEGVSAETSPHSLVYLLPTPSKNSA